MIPWQNLVGQTIDGSYRLDSLLGESAIGGVFTARPVIGGQIVAAERVVKLALGIAGGLSDLNRSGTALHLGLVHEHLNEILHAKMVTLPPPMVDTVVLMTVYRKAEKTLRQALREIKDAEARATVAREVGTSIGKALTYLHGRGIVHRDVKPDNILWSGTEWKLADLDITVALGSDIPDFKAIKGEWSLEISNITGTPLYMSPEAFAGKLSPATDVWGLGCVLAEILIGRPPFALRGKDDDLSDGVPTLPPGQIITKGLKRDERENSEGGDTMVDIMRRIMEQEPDFGDAGLPAPFDAVVADCLIKDFSRRSSAAAVVARLSDVSIG